MPTNILRGISGAPKQSSPLQRAGGTALDRRILIRAGRVELSARLLNTPTADRIWRALPIFSTAELWGRGEIHFKTVVESGRDHRVKSVVNPGEIVFAPDRDVIAIAFAPTPTSRRGELRLWSPSNVWAITSDDVAALAAVRPGEKVEVRKLEAAAQP
jgi:hypothetical protein